MQPIENEPNHAAEERRLVDRAIAGDAQAFAALCETHRKRVWRVAASVTKSAADADDLAQEAFVRAFGAIRGYRPEASFAAWLCRIALNAAHDYQKSAWRRRVLFWSAASSTRLANSEEQGSFPGGEGRGDGECDTPHREVERREIRRRVRAAVAQLKPTEGTPIWMIYFEEFTLAEVARLEGEPESTVRSRVRAGLKRLEKMLGDMRSFAVPDDEDEYRNDSGTLTRNLRIDPRRTARGIDCPISGICRWGRKRKDIWYVGSVAPEGAASELSESVRSSENGSERKRPLLNVNAVETLLRDAAAFEADAEVPEGLSYRALARQIARQNARERERTLPSRRLPRMTALLGGLSLGTLAGAAAAVILCLHTGTSLVPAPAPSPNNRATIFAPDRTPEANTLAQPTLRVPSPRRPIDAETQEPHLVAEALRPWQQRAARMPTRSGGSAQENTHRRADRVARPPLQMAVSETPRHEGARLGLAGSNASYQEAKAVPRERPALAQWQTETVDQTAYQLVSTGYVATPAEDGNGDTVVTPVQLQAGIEPTGGPDQTAPATMH